MRYRALAHDTNRVRAYTPGVTLHGRDTRESAAAALPAGGRRRRSATGDEQARRIAWGRKWGRLVSEATAAWREEGK